MKKLYSSRNFYIPTAVFLSLILFSCRSSSCPEDLDECEYFSKPDSAFINLSFEFNNDNPVVGYEVYRGNINLDSLKAPLIVDTTAVSDFSLLLPLGRYTVKANYLRDTDTVWVIRGGRTTHRKYKCEPDECYKVITADYELFLND